MHIVGISMGAMVACKLASKLASSDRKLRVQSLMLLGCPCGGLRLLRGSRRAWKYWVKQRVKFPFTWGMTEKQRETQAEWCWLQTQHPRRALEQYAPASTVAPLLWGFPLLLTYSGVRRDRSASKYCCGCILLSSGCDCGVPGHWYVIEVLRRLPVLCSCSFHGSIWSQVYVLVGDETESLVWYRTNQRLEVHKACATLPMCTGCLFISRCSPSQDLVCAFLHKFGTSALYA